MKNRQFGRLPFHGKFHHQPNSYVGYKISYKSKYTVEIFDTLPFSAPTRRGGLKLEKLFGSLETAFHRGYMFHPNQNTFFKVFYWLPVYHPQKLPLYYQNTTLRILELLYHSRNLHVGCVPRIFASTVFLCECILARRDLYSP